jgi:DNA-binding NarL/FixJ family response regulator
MIETQERIRGRLVVADDDNEVREALCDLLRAHGFAVVGQAADGSEAVAAAVQSIPDAVMMDLRMPGVDGIAAARQIKARFPNVQVIVLSAYDDESLHQLAADAGVYCYLVKGCPTGLIRDVVERACDFRRQLEKRTPGPLGP